MSLRIQEFPVAWEFPEPLEIYITWVLTRLKLFPPISQEFPTHGLSLNIPVWMANGYAFFSSCCCLL